MKKNSIQQLSYTIITRLLIGYISLVGSSIISQSSPESVHIEVKAQQRGALPILMVPMDQSHDTTKFNELCEYLKKDLSFTHQCAVTMQYLANSPTKTDFESFKKQGHELILFVQFFEPNIIEWRLYDSTGPIMLKGKRLTLTGTIIRGWAHALADEIWPALTGTPGFFSTKLAYCKDIKDKHARSIKHICIADYDGSHEQVLVNTHTLNIAPRWNIDTNCPLLFYSEHTNSNVRLMMSSMDKKRHVVVNFDGLTMLPAFSSDGKRVAFCASRGDGACDLYCFDPNGLKRLTAHQGNNIAPFFAHNDNLLYFCSDRDGAPHIYAYDMTTKNTEAIVDSGYCVSPTYCETTKCLGYAKMVQGTMQLFTYDTITKQHRQLTFDSGNKEECSWSPCGNYLLFSQEKHLKSRIALLNIHTGDKLFLTSAKDSCCYPTWSPRYAQLPVVS